MAEYSRFFDSTTYTEAQWNEYHRAIFSHNGYLSGKANELAVTQATPAAMSVLVDTGEAIVQGAWYQNSASKTMTIEAADGSNPRIDRIVLRLSFTANSIILAVLKGTAAASPTAPALTQDSTTWELSLAQIAVGTGVTSIVTANITDQRLTSACGAAACNIGEMYIDSDGTLVTSGKAIIMGTAKITGLGDPTGDQDADTKAARDAAINSAAWATLADPTFTGTPKAPTASAGTADTQIATTAYVDRKSSTGSYTGNNTTNRAIAHGMGIAPKYVMIFGQSGRVYYLGPVLMTTMTCIGAANGAGTVTDATTTYFYVGTTIGGDSSYSANDTGVVYYWISFG